MNIIFKTLKIIEILIVFKSCCHFGLHSFLAAVCTIPSQVG